VKKKVHLNKILYLLSKLARSKLGLICVSDVRYKISIEFLTSLASDKSSQVNKMEPSLSWFKRRIFSRKKENVTLL